MKRNYLFLLVAILMLTGFSACSKSTDEAVTTTTAPISQNEVQTESASKETVTSKTAVVYFSVTGNTEKVAKTIAKEAGADLYEIKPLIPYTDADIAYGNNNCRANQEQNDSSARPEIQNDLSIVTDYDVIYLGYPIWWGTNPRIIQTFLEKYDLQNAKIYLFCTSGSSGIETSVNSLQSQFSGLNIIDGKRFANASENEIDVWLETAK
ncbi:MAG: flavodoxin [Clostridia bacterium]|nr:flavodoxin [Clostridia bacterium]